MSVISFNGLRAKVSNVRADSEYVTMELTIVSDGEQQPIPMVFAVARHNFTPEDIARWFAAEGDGELFIRFTKD